MKIRAVGDVREDSLEEYSTGRSKPANVAKPMPALSGDSEPYQFQSSNSRICAAFESFRRALTNLKHNQSELFTQKTPWLSKTNNQLLESDNTHRKPILFRGPGQGAHDRLAVISKHKL